MFKKVINPKYVITAHYETHVAYTEQEKNNILACVGYDAQVVEVNAKRTRKHIGINPKFVINAWGESHIAYTEQEKNSILACVGYDAEVIKVN